MTDREKLREALYLISTISKITRDDVRRAKSAYRLIEEVISHEQRTLNYARD